MSFISGHHKLYAENIYICVKSYCNLNIHDIDKLYFLDEIPFIKTVVTYQLRQSEFGSFHDMWCDLHF